MVGGRGWEMLGKRLVLRPFESCLEPLCMCEWLRDTLHGTWTYFFHTQFCEMYRNYHCNVVVFYRKGNLPRTLAARGSGK